MTTQPTREQLQAMSERLLNIEIEARTARMEIAEWLDTPQPEASPAQEAAPELTPVTDKQHKALSGAWIGAFGRQPTEGEVKQLIDLASTYGHDKVIAKLYRPDLATIKGSNMAWLENNLRDADAAPVEVPEADVKRDNGQQPGESADAPAETGESAEPESDGQPEVSASHPDANQSGQSGGGTTATARKTWTVPEVRQHLMAQGFGSVKVTLSSENRFRVTFLKRHHNQAANLPGASHGAMHGRDEWRCVLDTSEWQAAPKEKNPTLFLTAPAASAGGGA